MRAIHIGLGALIIVGLGGAVALGQQAAGRGGPPPTIGGMPLRLPAPTDKAVD